MKKTVLYDKHIALNGKMVPFAGYLMPVQYEGVNIEHLHVRSSVGLFDVSHMGEFFLEGKNATDLLQLLCSNDICSIQNHKAQYTCLINEFGGIIDDLIIYKFNENKFMLVVNAGNINKDWEWIKLHNKKFGNKLENWSDKMSLLALQGPKSCNILEKVINFGIHALKNYSFIICNLGLAKNVIVSTTGYTGSGGVEIYCDNKDVDLIWKTLFDLGKEFDLKPIGLAARDTLRLEMGYCLYGNEINDKTNPIEANLKWITKLNKDFIGKKHVINTIEKGPTNKLIGFKILERGIPRSNYKIFDNNDNEIGIVTSGTMSPSLKQAIGLGYVKNKFSKPDSPIFIEIRNKKIKAVIVKTPFVKI